MLLPHLCKSISDPNRAVNPFVVTMSGEWSVDGRALARCLHEAIVKDAEIKKAEAGRRVNPGWRQPGTMVSRWTTGDGSDLQTDQIGLIFGLMRDNEEARKRILGFFGIPVPEAPPEVADPKLAEWLAEANYAYEHQGHDVIRTQLDAFRAFLRHISGGEFRKPANGDRGA